MLANCALHAYLSSRSGQWPRIDSVGASRGRVLRHYAPYTVPEREAGGFVLGLRASSLCCPACTPNTWKGRGDVTQISYETV